MIMEILNFLKQIGPSIIDLATTIRYTICLILESPYLSFLLLISAIGVFIQRFTRRRY